MTSGASQPARCEPAPGGGHIVLVGMMGAGKTTAGEELARRVGREFVDSDAEVETRSGVTGATVAAREGVAALHDLEARILLVALSRPEPAVIAAAASVVDSRRCRTALGRAALVVWLDVPVTELERRTARGDHRRPLARSMTQTLLRRRRRRFVRVADVRLDGTQPSDSVVAAILRELDRWDS